MKSMLTAGERLSRIFYHSQSSHRNRIIFIALAIALIFCCCDSKAETVYEYTDDNGIRYFSDTPPQTEQPVKEQRAYTSEPENHLHVVASEEQKITTLTIVNEYCGPAEVEISLTAFENMVSDPILPKRFVVHAKSRYPAIRLQSKNPKLAWHYQYHFNFILGAPDAAHHPPSPYRLPYPDGNAFRIIQAFNGSYSHHEDFSQYAVDFSMPIGIPIACVRDGVVMDVEQNYEAAGLEKEYYSSRWNNIRILHQDGTMAVYGHLKKNSARVKPGDFVKAGRLIAESGNTGFSTGPHLHFVIQMNRDLKYVSVPFEFKGPDGKGITPQEGMIPRANEIKIDGDSDRN